MKMSPVAFDGSQMLFFHYWGQTMKNPNTISQITKLGSKFQTKKGNALW